jgi:hypothetical protein
LKTLSDAEMDAAVLKFRQMKDAEEYYRELAESPGFKEGLEAAFARDPSFFTVDAAGWRPPQFCVDIPPARPNTTDWREHDKDRWKPIPGAAFPS